MGCEKKSGIFGEVNKRRLDETESFALFSFVFHPDAAPLIQSRRSVSLDSGDQIVAS